MSTPPAQALSPNDRNGAMEIYNALLKERIVFLGTDVNDEIANVITGQLLFLEGEDQFDDGERVGTEVVDEHGLRLHFRNVDIQLLRDDFFYFLRDIHLTPPRADQSFSTGGSDVHPTVDA